MFVIKNAAGEFLGHHGWTNHQTLALMFCFHYNATEYKRAKGYNAAMVVYQ